MEPINTTITGYSSEGDEKWQVKLNDCKLSADVCTCVASANAATAADCLSGVITYSDNCAITCANDYITTNDLTITTTSPNYHSISTTPYTCEPWAPIAINYDYGITSVSYPGGGAIYETKEEFVLKTRRRKTKLKFTL
jgi:hypothetical protein